MAKRSVSSAAVITLLQTLSHPVTLISILGPPFLVLNVHWLKILLPPGGAANELGIRGAVENLSTFAITDYVLQLYTLLLVLVVYYGDIIRNVIFLGTKGVLSEIADSELQMLFLGVSAVALIAFIVATGAGVFGHPTVAQMYYPENGRTWGELRWPPWTSPITIARGVMLILGFLLPVWIKTTRAKVTEKSVADQSAAA